MVVEETYYAPVYEEVSYYYEAPVYEVASAYDPYAVWWI